jgi:phytanoyl-CoA hydroxylase
MDLPLLTEDYPLTSAQIDQYRRDGFIKLEDVITGEALHRFRDAAATAVEQEKSLDVMGRNISAPSQTKGTYEQIFIQRVNMWQRHSTLRPFVTAPRFANLAARLSGTPVRIWHDQALFKEPGNGANRTPWHQDAPYWPHQDRSKQLSIWIALKDATITNGCMSFLPGTQAFGPKEPIRLDENPKSVLQVAPEATGIQPVTHEIKAGSATFHHGLCFHYAGPNRSQNVREAFVVIYMPANTRLDGQVHVVTEPLGLQKDDLLDGDLFPLVSTAGVT